MVHIYPLRFYLLFFVCIINFNQEPPFFDDQFQVLNISVNKPSKCFMTKEFDNWHADQVWNQLNKGIGQQNIKFLLKITFITLCKMNCRLIQTHNNIERIPEAIEQATVLDETRRKIVQSVGICRQSIFCVNQTFLKCLECSLFEFSFLQPLLSNS